MRKARTTNPAISRVRARCEEEDIVTSASPKGLNLKRRQRVWEKRAQGSRQYSERERGGSGAERGQWLLRGFQRFFLLQWLSLPWHGSANAKRERRRPLWFPGEGSDSQRCQGNTLRTIAASKWKKRKEIGQFRSAQTPGCNSCGGAIRITAVS